MNPFLSDVIRISIAFSIRITKFEAKEASDANSKQADESVDDILTREKTDPVEKRKFSDWPDVPVYIDRTPSAI